MTPKEKAIELYNTFRNTASVMEANVKSKNRTLIAVNEILTVCEKEISHCSDKTYFYWQEVKQEINKL
jgi:hypothetical protein